MAVLAGMLVWGAGVTVTVAAARESRDEIAQREHWQRTVAQVRKDLGLAKKRLNEAQLAYRKMRHRRRVRGQVKEQIVEELELAEVGLPLAQTAYDAAMIAARRAGVPSGWLRANPQDALPASAASR